MNQSETEKLKAQYEEFYSEDISYAREYILEIHNYGREHTKLMLNQYGPAIMQFEAGFALLSSILEKINYLDKGAWPEHRGIQYIFLIHNMKSLYASFDLLNTGFSESSLTLLRPVYEAIMNVIYISLYKHDPYKTLRGEFHLSSFIEQELKLTHWNDYSILSVFAHANKLEVFREIKAVGNGQPVTISYKFDRKNIEAAINYAHHAFHFIAKFIDEYLFISINQKLTQKDKDDLKKFIDIENTTRESHPTNHWKSMTRDVDYIFELIAISESCGDWKKYRNEKIKRIKKNFLNVLLNIASK